MPRGNGLEGCIQMASVGEDTLSPVATGCTRVSWYRWGDLPFSEENGKEWGERAKRGGLGEDEGGGFNQAIK